MQENELGKISELDAFYNPDRLCAIPRAVKRQEIGITAECLPFFGYDLWNHYEVSWLNSRGKPCVGVAQIIYDCTSPSIVESKSLKLYFNSLNHTRFKDIHSFQQTITHDISRCVGAMVKVEISAGESSSSIIEQTTEMTETNIDYLDIECDEYTVNPAYLSTNDQYVEEVLYSDLLRSNCLITHQPDWGSLQIAYKGRQIKWDGLLRYIVSYRNHPEFHEQCIERIFMDIMNHAKPDELSVYGQYTRRGGIDINPYRSSVPYKEPIRHRRSYRQ